MQRQEIHNNTHEQIEQYLRQALALVDTMEPPDDLRAAFFTKAADLLSGKQILMTQPQPVTLPPMQIPRGRGH